MTDPIDDWDRLNAELFNMAPSDARAIVHTLYGMHRTAGRTKPLVMAFAGLVIAELALRRAGIVDMKMLGPLHRIAATTASRIAAENPRHEEGEIPDGRSGNDRFGVVVVRDHAAEHQRSF